MKNKLSSLLILLNLAFWTIQSQAKDSILEILNNHSNVIETPNYEWLNTIKDRILEYEELWKQQGNIEYNAEDFSKRVLLLLNFNKKNYESLKIFEHAFNNDINKMYVSGIFDIAYLEELSSTLYSYSSILFGPLVEKKDVRSLFDKINNNKDLAYFISIDSIFYIPIERQKNTKERISKSNIYKIRKDEKNSEKKIILGKKLLEEFKHIQLEELEKDQ